MRGCGFGRRALMAGAVAFATIAVASAAMAQVRTFDVPAQPAASGIPTFARQAGVQILTSANLVRGKRTNKVVGNYALDDALRLLLQGTGLIAANAGSTGIITIQVAAPGEGGAGRAPAENESAAAEDVVVTGTRIRGASVTSPVTTITRAQIAESGYSDTGEVIRSLPQNFNGGQNPTVLLGTGDVRNQNATTGSGLDLRGLGPDATLTLLNGNRLAYGGFAQSVDISAIPLAAVERIEIVTDGASALYGSDAVAGVANVITRTDMNGVDTSLRLGGATDGGMFQRDASIAAGTSWHDGGMFAAYEYQKVGAVYPDQRDYLSYIPAGNQVYPGREQHTAFASLHQQLADGVAFGLDGQFLDRKMHNALSALGEILGEDVHSRVFSFAPRLDVSLPGSWHAKLAGTFSRDLTHAYDDATFMGAPLSNTKRCYCNTAYSTELSADGTLFRLPGGAVQLAAGAGYRTNRYAYHSIDYLAGTDRSQKGSQPSEYGFLELNVPLISPDMGFRGIRTLVATVALRHEHYRDFGNVTTPKLGFAYEPVHGVSIKGSWGRSFKAPTLIQQIDPLTVDLYPASFIGATGYPAAAGILFVNGTRGTLKPERAETWTGTLSIKPDFLPGFSIEATYFDINYRNRIVQPIDGVYSLVSTDPTYAQFLVRDPSPAQQAALIASAPGGITHNDSGYAYDPANVIGIAYNNYQNVARDHADGVDLAGAYMFAMIGGKTTISGTASWLSSRRELVAGGASVQIAGLIYNPPKFRARGGAAWAGTRLSAAVNVNYIGRITDNQQTPTLRQPGFTTVDATLRYRVPGTHGLLSGWEIGVETANLFNRRPPLRVPLANYVVNFDSTNYTAIGRTISGTVTKHW